jgi:hypothetical protein
MSDDPLGDIKLKEADSTGKQAVTSLPVLGSAVKTFDSVTGAAGDGNVTDSELRGVATQSTGFVQSCMDVASGIATDPIGWLVGQGLNFLLAVCQPLQDAIHFVSGDGPALANAAESFNNIGTGIAEFAQQFSDDATASLQSWQGEAAEAAGTKLGEFANGIRGTAGEAGNIAQLLQISSMVMTVIEDFIRALLTELVTWLITIWIPALAAAVPTCGASTAAAGSATGVRAGMTAQRATRQVGKLGKLLDLIRELLTKLRTVLGKTGQRLKKAMDAATANRLKTGFGKSMLNAGTGTWQGHVQEPGTLAGDQDNLGKAGDDGSLGTDQPTETTSGQLDF